MSATAVEAGWFPISLRLGGARVVLVGGGAVALNKGRLLLDHGARVEIVAGTLHPQIADWVASGRVSHVAGRMDEAALAAVLPELLRDCRLVYAATDDRALNRAVAETARRLNVPVCAVDDPGPSTFITPARVTRGEVTVSVSTGGGAPVLARRLREAVEALLPEGTGRLAAYMRARRARVSARHPAMEGRRRVWEDFLDGPGATAAMEGEDARADAALETALGAASAKSPEGEVWIVGAGPGDPDLLTLKALHLMQHADVILHDGLLSASILDRLRRDAERVFVGKRRGHAAMEQETINAEMIRYAREGKRVLRLKGGDPFLFGRGGEEMEGLMEAGIPFRIVPGVTAASGCGAYAGIPLTHRDCAHSCLFVTGHARAGHGEKGALDLPWEAMADRRQTVVIYMGLATLEAIASGLMRHGLPGDWPVAVIERGTWPDQRVLTGTLATIAARTAEAAVGSPALVIVGRVVEHRGESPGGESSGGEPT